jgi:ketosteroid isomerase-like protein
MTNLHDHHHVAATAEAVAGDELAALLRRTEIANSALLRGDIGAYLALISHAEDFTLMTPFGGAPTRGFTWSDARRAEFARFFRGGDGEVELVQSYASGNLVVLVVIERQQATIAHLPEQDWSLRVTLVYRRDAEGEWQLAHRHADPLVHGIDLEKAAAIARGA